MQIALLSPVPLRNTVLLLISFVAVACQSKAVRLTSEQKIVLEKLRTINPETHELPPQVPVVDVHVHTFNARYLPLRGILLGKRDALFPVTTVLSDNCSRLIAQALVDRTELGSIPGQKGVARVPDTSSIRAREHPGPLCRVFLDLIDKAIAKGAWDRRMTMMQKLQIVDDIARDMSLSERIAVRAAASMMGMDEHTWGGTETEKSVTGIQAAVRFLWIITQNDPQMAQLFREMHQGAPTKGKITLVSHMMDLGPVYAQESDGEALLHFDTQQVRRMEYYQNQPGSGLYYFVAYNPYRTQVGGGGSDAPLALVQEAYYRHGAKGVKIYPPSGYRAAGNDIPPRPRTLFTRQPGIQWDQRYGRFGATIEAKNQQLDAGMTRLLEWCIKEDVPVFAHCGYGEFEARKRYGEHHADPYYWEKFLEAHSTPGRPCTLRLCLAHAGGGDYWFGTGKHAKWGERVYDLCVRYPNVYCEISTEDSILDPERQAFFVDRMATLFSKSDGAAKSKEARYPFSRSLLYGTDWFLPDKGKPRAVLLATQQAFLHPNLKPHYKAYFSGNAKRYLKLDREGK